MNCICIPGWFFLNYGVPRPLHSSLGQLHVVLGTNEYLVQLNSNEHLWMYLWC